MEKLNDILDEMTKAGKPDDIFGNGEQFGTPVITGNKVVEWAERIKAALLPKSAKNENSADAICASVNNAAVLRDALEKVVEAYDSGAIRTEYNDPKSWEHDDELWYLKNDIDAALATPARNCDVGTSAEQAGRFQKFCHLVRTRSCDCSNNCPFINEPDIIHCQFAWAQMPHTEGGTQ